jgi:pyruvate-ferredoxin/flavodoxin oxidoreductase
MQTVKAFQEAESYAGTSLIIAYSHCIAHGYDMMFGADQQKLAVESGLWPLYRFDPRKIGTAENPFSWDSPPVKAKIGDYLKNEARFRMTEAQNAERYRHLVALAGEQSQRRARRYQQIAATYSSENAPALAAPAPAPAAPTPPAKPPASAAALATSSAPAVPAKENNNGGSVKTTRCFTCNARIVDPRS